MTTTNPPPESTSTNPVMVSIPSDLLRSALDNMATAAQVSGGVMELAARMESRSTADTQRLAELTQASQDVAKRLEECIASLREVSTELRKTQSGLSTSTTRLLTLGGSTSPAPRTSPSPDASGGKKGEKSPLDRIFTAFLLPIADTADSPVYGKLIRWSIQLVSASVVFILGAAASAFLAAHGIPVQPVSPGDAHGHDSPLPGILPAAADPAQGGGSHGSDASP